MTTFRTDGSVHLLPINIHVEDVEEDDHLHNFYLHLFEDFDFIQHWPCRYERTDVAVLGAIYTIVYGLYVGYCFVAQYKWKALNHPLGRRRSHVLSPQKQWWPQFGRTRWHFLSTKAKVKLSKGSHFVRRHLPLNQRRVFVVFRSSDCSNKRRVTNENSTERRTTSPSRWLLRSTPHFNETGRNDRNCTTLTT